jgi:hypothetical protein
MVWWVNCYNCNGCGYNNNEECLICHYVVSPNVILRGKIYVSDNAEPVSPPSSPR